MRKLPALTVLGSGGLEEVWTQLRFCRQEGMLRDLQKSVEEEEQVWKAKLTASEEELQKVSVRGTPGFVACVQKAGVGYKSDGNLCCSCQPGTLRHGDSPFLPKSTPPPSLNQQTSPPQTGAKPLSSSSPLSHLMCA